MPATTIATIDTVALRIPLDTWAPPPAFAGRPRTRVEAALVRVTTESGVVGWGEAYGSSGSTIPAAFEFNHCP
jgi:L-alanine-DL-glutamate epimerase-like enolase superfamily enzyme